MTSFYLYFFIKNSLIEKNGPIKEEEEQYWSDIYCFAIPFTPDVGHTRKFSQLAGEAGARRVGCQGECEEEGICVSSCVWFSFMMAFWIRNYITLRDGIQ